MTGAPRGGGGMHPAPQLGAGRPTDDAEASIMPTYSQMFDTMRT